MDGDGYRLESLGRCPVTHDADKASNGLVFDRASFDPSNASRNVVGELSKRIAELDWQHSDLTTKNIQLEVKVYTSPVSWSPPCLIDGDRAADWLAHVQSTVSWYTDRDFPTLTCGAWPLGTGIPAPLALAACALDGQFIAIEECAPLPAARDESASLPVAASTAEPRPIEPGPNFASDVPTAFRPVGSRDLSPLPLSLSILQASTALVPMPEARVISMLVALSGAVQEILRGDLLRMVDGKRAVLGRMLLLVFALLSRTSGALAFALILVAVSRRYGRRGEPDHHLLPALRPMSVVIGEAAVRAL